MTRRNSNSPLRADPPSLVQDAMAPARPLHRLAAVRQARGLSQREMAQRLRISLSEVQRQERETSDLRLSTLNAWAKALGVSITALLTEPDGTAALPSLRADQTLRLMEMVREIRRRARRPGVQRMADSLMGQLLEIAPELEDVGLTPESSYHPTDSPRLPARRAMPENIFVDWDLDG